jgi:hypothetical protein
MITGRSCMKSAVLVFLTLAVAATIAKAAETREIELTDGSVITGEVVSLSRGVYTVRSATLGTIKIEESKVRIIRSQGSTGNAGDNGGQVKSLQDKMMSDSEIINMVRSLQNDPDVQRILRDPEIMKAVQAGDISALMANPQFMKLLNKQAVQEIKNKITR